MHQIAPFLKIFSEEHAPEPPSKRVASLLQKYFEPPRNKILDTPLIQHNYHRRVRVFLYSTFNHIQ